MSQLSLSGFANRKALKDIVTVPKSVQRDRAIFLTASRYGAGFVVFPPPSCSELFGGEAYIQRMKQAFPTHGDHRVTTKEKELSLLLKKLKSP